MEEGNRNELARWTPALHAEAKALVDKAYPDTQSALRAILASKHRRPGSSDRDKARHPIETLEFFGFKQTMTTVEIAPGEGWFTEILAPALRRRASRRDDSGSEWVRRRAEHVLWPATDRVLDHSPELYGRAQALVVDDKEPSLGAEGSADLVLSMRTLHGNVANGTLDAWLAAVHRVLKSKVFSVSRSTARGRMPLRRRVPRRVICRRNG